MVADLKHNGLDDPGNPSIYVNFCQRAHSSFEVALKTAVPPESLMPPIRSELKAVDAERPITNPQTMTAMVSAPVGARRLSLHLGGVFAIIGLLSRKLTAHAAKHQIRLCCASAR